MYNKKYIPTFQAKWVIGFRKFNFCLLVTVWAVTAVTQKQYNRNAGCTTDTCHPRDPILNLARSLSAAVTRWDQKGGAAERRFHDQLYNT
jgi:hypothetical protein